RFDQAKAHYHPALIEIANVLQSEKKEHVDTHYCLALIKALKTFTSTLSNISVLVFQDDKTKVNVGISAICCTFQTIQLIAALIKLEDYDFLIGIFQKLVPSIYLIINLADSNDTIRTEQLTIYV
ncbi:15391_t:CDS:1, partial [Cetraspora pellucida]